MATLPYISDGPSGIHQVCTASNTDYTVALPDGATGAVIWFETSAVDGTIIRGRIGVDVGNTAVTGITGTDTKLGYHPAMPVEYTLSPSSSWVGNTYTRNNMYLHVACATAGAVVKGMWLYATDR